MRWRRPVPAETCSNGLRSRRSAKIRARIAVGELTGCRVVDNGETVELGLLDRCGMALSVQLSFDQSEALVMTLPHLLAQALKRRTGNAESRYVFRIGAWTIEGAESGDCLIVTVKTSDGFEVSLGLPFDACRALGASLHYEAQKDHSPGTPARAHRHRG
jgi:hypothetical protein